MASLYSQPITRKKVKITPIRPYTPNLQIEFTGEYYKNYINIYTGILTFNAQRGKLQQQVFQSSHNLPTMTLEQYAAHEMEALKERQENELQQQLLNPKTKRFDQLVDAGEEDDLALVEKAVYADRKWDDWKDAHPRGHGNKKGSQF